MASEISVSNNSGTSIDDAVVIDGVLGSLGAIRVEKLWIRWKLSNTTGGKWQIVEQHLLEKQGSYYDCVIVEEMVTEIGKAPTASKSSRKRRREDLFPLFETMSRTSGLSASGEPLKRLSFYFNISSFFRPDRSDNTDAILKEFLA